MDAVIIGAGSMARMVINILRHDHNIQIVGLVDVERPKEGQRVMDVPVIGDHSLLEGLLRQGVRGALVAVGDNYIREQRFYEVSRMGFDLITAVHPNTQIAPDVVLGDGCIVGEGVILSTGVVVHNNVIIEPGTVISVSTEIGENVFVGPGVCIGGGVRVGRNCHLDPGVSVAPNIRVGKNVFVEAGTAVRADVPDQPHV